MLRRHQLRSKVSSAFERRAGADGVVRAPIQDERGLIRLTDRAAAAIKDAMVRIE
jgi:hypothetical protein